MTPLKSAERAKIDEIVERVKQQHHRIVHQIRWELDRGLVFKLPRGLAR